MSWMLLSGAILAEVAGTLSLRVAATGRRRWYLPVAVGYLLAFALLSAALAAGMPLGVAYGIWAAVGIVATALLSRLLFREALTPVMLAGMGLIAVGVLLVELGGAH
ncbi:DMT family transporter [Brachybacterium saurashtrense]|uniref:QacE family quaternary ammonium compound efflux SMR transporter n=1 Tax=Brachybacterium saurashtrense TaxID=556288 RepID=A0A345YRF3_9MICO|nr:SMR family transporter [Brachybacterium saurashtrense]AXK46505.1 QacE family quaternary ammonium compound efflux SMR transporter [Brachybacterium saurashtrense]RRR24246.1 QacE family quaternary ammonium compound efflux SMR transporter [Brachybacterium saurashtrense]